MARYARIMPSVSLLDELDAMQRAQVEARFAPVPLPPDGFDDLVADYWARLNAEILEANAAQYAADRAAQHAEAKAEADAERLEARRLRRRTRVFGVEAILAEIPTGAWDSGADRL